MIVSTRNTFIAGATSAAFLALGGTAFAGGMGKSGAGPVIPGVPVVTAPGMGTATGSGCCGGMPATHSVTVPGVTLAGPNVVQSGNLNVQTGVVMDGSSLEKTSSFLQRQDRQQRLAGSGGSYFSPEVAPSSVLNIPGETERYTDTVTEQVPVVQNVCVNQIATASSLRPVQAVCLDDKGTPHPASQVSSGRQVAGSYSGEVFRCVAGTKMQVTLGQMSGTSISFDSAETFSCKKGEALVHKPGGELSCATQMPQRDCNERSLLRRNGPGVKLVSTRGPLACVPETRTTYQTVTRQVERVRQLPGQSMVLNGGVGNGVN